MTKAVTLHLPDTLFEKAQSLATMQNLALHDYLLNWVIRPEIDADTLLETDSAVDAEERAFRALHPRLMQQFLGQYVAVAGGQVVDHDADQIALYRRVRLTYPDRYVLIAQVQQAPEEVFVFRSPRFNGK